LKNSHQTLKHRENTAEKYEDKREKRGSNVKKIQKKEILKKQESRSK
jgi:hypothetical protein